MTIRERDDAKQRIQESAAQLFAEGGVHGTGLAEISQHAEVSKGTLYYHYTTKDALVFDVCEIHMSHMINKMYAWLSTVRDDSNSNDAFTELIEILTDDVFHVKLHMALCAEAALGQFELQQLIRTKYGEMGLLLDIASLRMDVKLHESPHLKQMFFMALDGLMLHSLMGMEAIDSRFLLERIYK
ncbi:MAG: TetR/AcrR family transcriptional regulator [Clostridia bacterium]|nr:TetR/AcrR family transcriptional regulator [Clostridia bacterium]